MGENAKTPLNHIHQDMEDEEIIRIIQSGDLELVNHLMEKYKNFVRAKTKKYYLSGADREDIIQEGMIGLFKAIRDFRKDKLTSFRAFAELCITRQIITAVKTASRQKHIPLNSYVSLDRPIYEDDSERTLLDVFSMTNTVGPEDVVIHREYFDYITSKIAELLSDLEKQVLSLYLDGKTYQEISKDLNRHVKSIDNALQRIKKKLEKHKEETVLK